MQLNQLKLNKITKQSWIRLSREDFISLINNFVNNLDNDNYKTVNNCKYDFKNVEKFLLEIIKKTGEHKALKLYNNLIEPDIDELKKSTSRSKYKRNIILNVLRILKLVLSGIYLHYGNESELKP